MVDRSNPFSKNEKLSLINLCTSNEDRINPNSRVPSADQVRTAAWDNVMTEFNAVNGTNRSSAQLKRKWEKIKSDAKKEANLAKKDQRATGE